MCRNEDKKEACKGHLEEVLSQRRYRDRGVCVCVCVQEGRDPGWSVASLWESLLIPFMESMAATSKQVFRMGSCVTEIPTVSSPRDQHRNISRHGEG